MAKNLSTLAVGSKIKFGRHSVNGEAAQDITWIVVAQSHSAYSLYPTNSTTLLAEKILDLRCFDAAEPNSSDANVKTRGYHRGDQSNIDQWLNSDAEAGQWYTAQHSTDQAPNETYSTSGTHYVNRPGFLNLFTVDEKEAILITTIEFRSKALSGSYTNLSAKRERKIFLPSLAEVGIQWPYSNLGGDSSGTWLLFTQNNNNTFRKCTLTQQAYNYTLSTTKTGVANPWYWMTRNPNMNYPDYYHIIDSDGARNELPPNYGHVGVRPALNLANDMTVTDTVDNDGCYQFIWNSAPSTPVTLNVPSSVYSGKNNIITWSSATDPEGHSVSYELECAYDGGEFSNIYSGTSLSYTHIPSEATSIQYRVRAVDSKGKHSGYTTSQSVTVINNQSPVISGTDENIGIKTDSFGVTYSVSDVENNTVTITEKIDDVEIRSYVATLGVTNTFAVEGISWLKLTNGTHTMTITASDGFSSPTARTYTFTKSVTKFNILTNPMESSGMPIRILIKVSKEIPEGAIFTAEVCNNGNDAEPTWEDASSEILRSQVHVFENKSKTADTWAVRVRISVDRNGAAGACYISAIGGNFE